jgi:meso-butanediol dehydrogenase/(S,S)-butanediol dehydrogenase/diacetyl reductase
MTQSKKADPRHALVTGGASGFGLAIARSLLAQGAHVAIADIHAGRLKEAAQSLESSNVLSLQLDVTSVDSVRSAVESCKATFGQLDTLVNSAGVIHIAPLADISEREWDHVIDVDLKGVFLCCQAAAPLLCASGRGRIVNIGSDASKLGCGMIVSYCAAKFGVVGLTKALAAELAPHQVTVNCVCPVGVSSTSMGQEVLSWKMRVSGAKPQEILAATAAGIPLQRNPTSGDIVNAAMFFLADDSSFLTGVAWDVDGGMLSVMPMPGAAK